MKINDYEASRLKLAERIANNPYVGFVLVCAAMACAAFMVVFV